MDSALTAIGKGVVLVGKLCVIGIAFFGVTKIVGQTMVRVSDAALDELKEVQKTVDCFGF